VVTSSIFTNEKILLDGENHLTCPANFLTEINAKFVSV